MLAISSWLLRKLQESTICHPLASEFLDTGVSESLKRAWRDYLEQAALSIDHNNVGELREIHVPALILWGQQDAHFPLEEQERPAAAPPVPR